MKPLLPVLAAVALAACAQTQVLPPPAALAQRVSTLSPNACNDATARVLANAGVAAEQVDSLFYQPVMGGPFDKDHLVGYIAWTRLRNQPGFLVANMDTDELGSFCHIRTVYTRGGLEVAGLPAFSY